MINTITREQTKLNFNKICQEVADNEAEYIIKMDHGRDLALISADELESLKETLYLLKAPNNSSKLLDALEQTKSMTLQPQSIDEFFSDLEIQQSNSTPNHKLKESLGNRDSLLKIMDEISQEAMEKGLTPEIL